MAGVVLEDVVKVYEGGLKVVDHFNLNIADREFVVLVGPSGCGKSTTLRMIAGLEEVSSGTISIGGRVVNDVAPKDRDIAMVFQSYALYPHMSVYDNMAFALKLRSTPKAVISPVWCAPASTMSAGIASPTLQRLKSDTACALKTSLRSSVRPRDHPSGAFCTAARYVSEAS